jgi:HlyD family secretion protein
MKKKVLVFAILLLAVALGSWFWRNRPGGRADGSLELRGNVDIREVNLGFRVSGRLAEVLRDEGDPVKAGEVIARLDDEPLRREVEQARGQLEALRARLQLVETGNRPQEIAQARAVLREREVTCENAERLFKRQQELYRTRVATVQERDDAEANFHEAEARRKSAAETLNLLEAGFRAEDVAQAKADVSRAEAALAAAELRLQDTVLKSPSDGVVFTRAQEPGAILQTGTTVLTISLEKPVWIRAFVSEPDLGRIHPGTRVEIFTDSRDKPYHGQVGYISPRSEFTPRNVETPELRTSLVYRLRVVVDDADAGLRQGMPVTVVPTGEGSSRAARHPSSAAGGMPAATGNETPTAAGK